MGAVNKKPTKTVGKGSFRIKPWRKADVNDYKPNAKISAWAAPTQALLHQTIQLATGLAALRVSSWLFQATRLTSSKAPSGSSML